MQTRRLDNPGLREKALAPVRMSRRLKTERTWRGSAGYRLPLNGQRLREQVIRTLIRDFEPDAIVETGTCMGWSTRWFSQLADVYSVEVDPGFFGVASRRLRDCDNVTLICGRSTDALRELAREGVVKRPFAYLDAHWESDLPLGEEVELLLANWPDFIAAVDDFEVPGEEYGYDTYDKPLSLDSFEFPSEVMIAFPAAPAAEETGHRRGTLYLARGDAAIAAQGAVDAGLLRTAQLTPPH
jgi:predicted O-methyltransferase YrrM